MRYLLILPVRVGKKYEYEWKKKYDDCKRRRGRNCDYYKDKYYGYKAECEADYGYYEDKKKECEGYYYEYEECKS